MKKCSELAAVGNDDLLAGGTTLAAEALNLLDNIKTLDNAAEDAVLAVEPRGLLSADEELGAVRVGASVGHAENAWSGVLQGEVLVGKLSSVDGLATSAIVVGEVATLAHESRDNTVEGGVLVTEALLASAKSTEVLGGLGNNIATQFHDNSADRGATGGHVKENTGPGHDSCKEKTDLETNGKTFFPDAQSKHVR